MDVVIVLVRQVLDSGFHGILVYQFIKCLPSLAASYWPCGTRFVF